MWSKRGQRLNPGVHGQRSSSESKACEETNEEGAGEQGDVGPGPTDGGNRAQGKKCPHCPMARELKDTENWKQKPKGHMAFQFLFHV